MRDFIAKKVKELQPSGIRKFFNLASDMEDVISLGVGEPDFDTPWRVREEGIYSLERGNTFYTANAGLKELRVEISRFLKRKYDLNYNYLDEIVVTVGGSEAIDIALRAMIEAGDEVIIPQPSYVSYAPCAILAGAKVKTIELKKENKFKLTKQELLAAITPKSKILILSFPNNPTGSIMTLEDLQAIKDVIIEHDLFVLSDEIYSELTYDNKHASIGSLEGMKERCLIINGFSKAYSMTGWRLGYACGPKDVIAQMTKIHQYAIMCAPTTSQFAAIEALKNCDQDVLNMRGEYDKRRRYLVDALQNMGMECFMPQGAFYVFPCIKKYKMTSEEFARNLLYQQRVVVVPGTAFGDSGEGFIRISYAYSLDDLKRALDRLAAFLIGLK